MSEHMSPIPSRIYNAAVGGHVCGPEDVDFGQKVVHLVKYDRAGNEVSFESQVTQANKIYVIHDDFVLSSNVTIPANCVLEFDGGSISGAYTLTGNNTVINAVLVKIFNTGITINGTWNIAVSYPEWFGAKGDSTTDDTEAIQAACNLASVASGKTCKLLSKKYLISDSIQVPVRTIINGIYSRTKGDPDHNVNVTATCIYLKQKANLSNGYFILNTGCSISNLTFYEYEQNPNNVVAYAPVISDGTSSMTHVQIKHLTFINIYSGIHISNNAENITIEDIVGCILKEGITIATQSSDVTRIKSVHFNYNIISPNNAPDTVDYGYYAADNAIGIDITFADGILIDDFFAYGLKIGILLRESSPIACMIVNSGFDRCSIGIENHVTETIISNCYFTCIYSGNNVEKTSVACIKDYSSAKISNCKFSAFEHKAIEGYNSIIDNCTFNFQNAYFLDDNTGSIIYMDGTRGKVSNCVFYLTELAITGMYIVIFTSIGVYEATGNIFYDYLYATNGYLYAPNGTLFGEGNVAVKGENSEYIITDTNLLNLSYGFQKYGDSSNRPSGKKLYVGRQYFDTTLNKPIYWTGTAWVDATGATV